MLLGKRGIVGRWMSHFTSIPFPAPVSLLRAPCNAAPEPECQRRRAAYEGVNQVTSVHLGPKRMPKQHWGRRGNTSPHPRLGAAQARDRSLRRVPQCPLSCLGQQSLQHLDFKPGLAHSCSEVNLESFAQETWNKKPKWHRAMNLDVNA